MRPQLLEGAIALWFLILSAGLPVRDVSAQQAPGGLAIFMNAVELKGSTTTEKLAPPRVNPAGLSKGYAFKGPGDADKNDPHRWEVASYTFTPGFITAQRGDTVTLSVFVVNGDHHDVHVIAPDGQVVVPSAPWNRGQEYRVSFVAEKVGTYRLSCATHAPTMTANILVFPR